MQAMGFHNRHGIRGRFSLYCLAAKMREKLSELAREIEARRTGVYRLSDEERAAIEASRRGPLASDDEVEAFWKARRHWEELP